MFDFSKLSKAKKATTPRPKKTSFAPMLAAKADTDIAISFPVLGSPKIDGVRAMVKDGVVLSRSGKAIPHPKVQRLFGHLHGLDGELVVGEPNAPDTFRSTQAVMSHIADIKVRFYVFDCWLNPEQPYSQRFNPTELNALVVKVEQTILNNRDELDAFEAKCLAEGYEGIMLRKADAPYKFGRSTAREGYLLKVKRFEDAEAIIVGFEEQKDSKGCPKSVLGALHVRDSLSGVEFAVGSGFTENERVEFWGVGSTLCGSIIRYRHFPVGRKDKPRFPIYSGMRNRIDL